MITKVKEAIPTLCVVGGVSALVAYAVMFSVAWGFYDQGYPNGIPVRNAALVSTVPLFFIIIICSTCILTLCCKNLWMECCPSHSYNASEAVLWLSILSPIFMTLAGLFALVGAIMFAVIAATFVPQDDITNLFEVHLFGAAASVFGAVTGLCCCCAGMLCCCALRGGRTHHELVQLQEGRGKLTLRYVETSI